LTLLKSGRRISCFKVLSKNKSDFDPDFDFDFEKTGAKTFYCRVFDNPVIAGY